jgi:hypothetical protein
VQEIDLRLVQVGIQIRGIEKTYREDLAIVASGVKFSNANQNECEIRLANLDEATKNYLLTETSPFNLNRTPKILTLKAGRRSYGVTQIFVGNIVSSTLSQPPDTIITLRCLTGNYQKGNIIASSQTGQAKLSQIAQGVAKDLNLTLNFQAQDKQISNYSYSGAALKQVDKLGESGYVNAYVDDGVLVVKDYNVALSSRTRVVNASNGMIGIPEVTEVGVKVKFLLDAQTTLGGGLIIESDVYPAVNGSYIIYKLSFEIASREEPFYWIAEAKRL